MPYLPPARCLECRGAPAVRRGRCLPCARAHDRARGSRQARGYDATHNQLRRLVLERDGYRCRLRLRGCTGLATSADHVLPLSRGGVTTMENLVAACRHCNSAKAGRMGRGAGAAAGVSGGGGINSLGPPGRRDRAPGAFFRGRVFRF